MSTLKEPVYILDSNSQLFKLYMDKCNARNEAEKAFKAVENEFPQLSDGNLAVWSGTYMGIPVGTAAEQTFDSELLKKEKNGVRPFKKKSKTLSKIIELSDGLFSKMSESSSDYGFELCTHFGINAVNGTHLVGDNLYLSLRYDPEHNEDELTPVVYSKYLKEFADSMED